MNKTEYSGLKKIVSWNVNSVNARLPHLLDYLRTEQPDILCLQELKCMTEKYPKADIEALGYGSQVFGQKAYNGVAILSKSPLELVSENFDDNASDVSARFIACRQNDVVFMCAYVPNGQSLGSEKFLFKLDWLHRMRKYLEAKFSPRDKIVLVGDFNIAPDDRDVYDPVGWKEHIHCSAQERESLSLVTRFGFIDTFRIHNQKNGQFSWWDYRDGSFLENRGLRIDLIFATPSMALKCKGSRIAFEQRSKERPSDHAPVESFFDI